MMQNFVPQEIIRRKRRGQILTEGEIEWFITNYVSGALPDYQMSALLMAIFFQGLDAQEILALTQVMLHSGEVVDFSHLAKKKFDKHSTGGIGDKTSLILAPIVAACGIAVPMISGRGLGHTGGTLDKLESIPGFSTQLSLVKFKELVEVEGLSFIGQTPEICPADKQIYALRDVTATVESIGLITASILSKKLAEGIDGLVLDVKAGRGAFMKTMEDARALANSLGSVAARAGKKCVALLTNMNEPLGRFAGHAHEIHECVEILRGKKFLTPNGRDLYADTRDLSVELAAWMIFLADVEKSLDLARTRALRVLESGEAFRLFDKICAKQGGNLSALNLPTQKYVVPSPRSGYVAGFQNEKIGDTLVSLGAGRKKATDSIRSEIGFEFHKKQGDPVSAGEPLLTLHGVREHTTSDLAGLVEISAEVPEKAALIFDVLSF